MWVCLLGRPASHSPTVWVITAKHAHINPQLASHTETFIVNGLSCTSVGPPPPTPLPFSLCLNDWQINSSAIFLGQWTIWQWRCCVEYKGMSSCNHTQKTHCEVVVVQGGQGDGPLPGCPTSTRKGSMSSITPSWSSARAQISIMVFTFQGARLDVSVKKWSSGLVGVMEELRWSCALIGGLCCDCCGFASYQSENLGFWER